MGSFRPVRLLVAHLPVVHRHALLVEVPPGLLVLRVLPAPQVLLGPRALPEPQAVLAPQVLLAPMETQAPREPWALPEPMVWLVQPVLEGIPVPPERLASTERPDPLALPELWELQAPPEPQAQREQTV